MNRGKNSVYVICIKYIKVLEEGGVIHWSVILSEEAERNVQQVAGTFFFFFKFLHSEEMFLFPDLAKIS